jgi:hypothetical protein
MARSIGYLAGLAVLAGSLSAARGFAEAPDAAPAPAEAAADAKPADVLPGLPRPPDQPDSLFQPPRPVYAAAPLSGPYFERDALLDPPELPPPGWFADVEAGLVKAHVKNKLSNAAITGGGAPDVVSLPSAPLGWTVSPRFAVGHRLESGFGEVYLAYRFLTTEGNGSAIGPDAPAALKSRLDLNIIDLDYASREFSLWPHWDMKWWIGGRYAAVYFDSRADEPFDAAAAGSDVFERRTSNSFVGFGPHAGVEAARYFEGTGLSVFASIDGWISLGRIRQGFFEVPTTSGPTEETRVSSSQAVPTVNVQAGLRWQPPGYRDALLFLGYQNEYWWNVGRFSSTADSRGELWDQGVVLRAEFSF